VSRPKYSKRGWVALIFFAACRVYSLLTILSEGLLECGPFLVGTAMHLLYADESGSLSDPGQRHFVLASVSVFEREPHWIEQELNKIRRPSARMDVRRRESW